jgi:hypothetical protein
MWGTREPPDWLAKRWPCKHSHSQGEGESSEGGAEEGKAGGAGGAEGRGEAEGHHVQAGSQRRDSWASTGIRLPQVPLPKVSLGQS